MEDLVSVVILNWNGTKYLNKCLEGVTNQTYRNIEIILVDNGSTDNSLFNALVQYRVQTTIRNPENVGFAKGMNIGIENSKGTYVMALNMDVYLESHAIELMIQSLKTYAAAGAVMGKEFSWTKEGFEDTVTNSSGPGFLKLRSQGFTDKNRIDQTIFSFGAMGSFPLFRKKSLLDIHKITGYYFDPKFQTGWEDKDIFFRLHHAGWKFLYNPTSIGYHAVSGSADNKEKLTDKDVTYQQRIFRNRYFFIFKNYPLKLFLLHSPVLFAVELLLYPYYLIRNVSSALALFKGQLEFFRKVGFLKKDRSNIMNNSKMGFLEIQSYFKKF